MRVGIAGGPNVFTREKGHNILASENIKVNKFDVSINPIITNFKQHFQYRLTQHFH